MARSAGLVVRVVLVRGPGASDARRRVADVLLRAAASDRATPPTPEPSVPDPAPPAPRSTRAA